MAGMENRDSSGNALPTFKSLRTKVASWLESGCAVESGEFGQRLVPSGDWGANHERFMADRSLTEIHFNRERGFTSHGDYAFLARLQRPLVGLKIVDSEARDISPLEVHAKDIRSLDLTFLGKLKKPFAFDQFEALERLSVLVSVPQMERVFLCSRLERLALSRYTGVISGDSFAKMSSLTSLFLSAVKLEDLTALRGLAGLEKLTVASVKGLRSLNGLEGVSSLRELTIESCPGLGSLRPIEGLDRIQKLWLYNCGPVESLSPIKTLVNLREINLIGNTTVTDGDLSVLCGLPKLKTVCIVEHSHYRPRALEVNRNP